MNISRIRPSFGLKNTYNAARINYGAKSNSLNADTFTFRGNLEDKIRIIPAQEPTSLEKNIEKNLGIKATPTVVKKFQNGETYINIQGKLSGKDVYLMPSSAMNPNDRLMETYLKADAARRAGANHVIALLPNFDYARQERRVEDGEPIAARLNMDLLRTSGVDRVITTDLHAATIEGFADNTMPVTHLKSMPLMKEYIDKKGIENIVVVSPDLGGTKRVENLADALGCDKATIHKHRSEHNEAQPVSLIGNVKDKNCIIYDDMIDTAGTIAGAARMLKEHGAKDIYVCAAHGLFNGKALSRLQDAPIKEVIVTNTVERKDGTPEKIKQIDISSQITETIKDLSS